jgi:hypothetical protein
MGRSLSMPRIVGCELILSGSDALSPLIHARKISGDGHI